MHVAQTTYQRFIHTATITFIAGLILGGFFVVVDQVGTTAVAHANSESPQCSFLNDEEDHDYIIEFGNKLSSSDHAKLPTFKKYEESIPEGNYTVHLESWDDAHSEKQNQSDERWFLKLNNSSGATLASTGESDELPDSNEERPVSTTAQYSITVPAGVTQIVTQHAHPQSGINSVTPVCAVFDKKNEGPIAKDDATTTPKNTSVTLNVLLNDTDPEKDPLSITDISDPTPNRGTISTTSTEGEISYDPKQDFTGKVTFEYTIEDDSGEEDTATVTITVEEGGQGGHGESPALTICKTVVDEDGNIVDGANNDGEFSISIYDDVDKDNEIKFVDFDTPLTYTRDILNDNGSAEDVECTTVDVEIGEYYYGEETIGGNNWSEPQYNDQFSGDAESLDDFYTYSDELFDNNPNNNDENERNRDADGHIVISENRPHRTLLISNTMKEKNQEQPNPAQCPFDQSDDQEDGKVVFFDDSRKIRSDQGKAAAHTPKKNVSLSKGKYKVQLYSYDQYDNRANATQPNENWVVEFFNNSSVFATSSENKLLELEDGVDIATSSVVVNSSLALNKHVDGVRGFHAAYPGSNPNSLNPRCAAFKRVGDLDTENQAPTAKDDSATTTEDVAVDINVRKNDEDDGPKSDLTIIDVGTTASGTTATTSDPNDIRFTPDSGFTSTATFEYTIEDKDGATDTANVTVTVEDKSEDGAKECSDNKDNDGDGLVDEEDPGCHDDFDPDDDDDSYDPDDDNESVDTTLRVCKIALSANGDIIKGNNVNATFSIALGNASTSWNKEANFSTPLSYQDNVLKNEDGNEAECVTYEVAPGVYTYDEEDTPNNGWETPLYNDQFTADATSTESFYPYSLESNEDADGIIEIEEDEQRTLLLLNQRAADDTDDDDDDDGDNGDGGGGGGSSSSSGSGSASLRIFNEDVESGTTTGSAVVTWETNRDATSRVVYGTSSLSSEDDDEDNYGYRLSTDEVDNDTEEHSVTITGLEEGVTYYFRPVSDTRYTSEEVGDEVSLRIGEILGAETSQCNYLNDYLHRDWNNNEVEVLKLQSFLRVMEGYTNVQLTGNFDQATFNAVESFQMRYSDDILAPWGYRADDPTGFVYYTTRKKINEIVCDRPFPLTAHQQQEIDNFYPYAQYAPGQRYGVGGTLDNGVSAGNGNGTVAQNGTTNGTATGDDGEAGTSTGWATTTGTTTATTSSKDRTPLENVAASVYTSFNGIIDPVIDFLFSWYFLTFLIGTFFGLVISPYTHSGRPAPEEPEGETPRPTTSKARS